MPLFNLSRLQNFGKPVVQAVVPGTLTKDKMTWSNTAGTGSAYVVGADSLVCKYVVPPQQFHYWGYGNSNEQANQGYMFVSFQDALAVQIDGVMTLRKSDANGKANEFVVSYDTAILRGSTTLKTQQIPLPAQPQFTARINDILSIYMNVRTTTGNGTIDQALSEFYIPESYGFE